MRSTFKLRVMTCSYAARTVLAGYNRGTVYHVINPITAQWTTLPPLPDQCTQRQQLSFSVSSFLVGFDPYNSICSRFFQEPQELDPYHRIRPLGLNDCDKDERGGGGKWCLENQLYFNQIVSERSPWLSKYVMEKNPYLLVLAYHPNDRDITYLMIDFKVALCNLRRKTLEVVCDFPDYHPSYNVFNFVLPCWPTPIHSSLFLCGQGTTSIWTEPITTACLDHCTDGRFHEKENLERCVRDALSRKRMVAFLVLDGPQESIMDLMETSFEGGCIKFSKYMWIPFPSHITLC
uniref:Uncharacterized protein n=1 Tax=Quercus lobata TaxID=97700 RepID=A0A7N2LKP0_QUELO